MFSARQCRSRITALVLTAFAAVCGTGCTSSVAMQGRDQDIKATYALGTLRAELPPSVSPLIARAAAESALRARGYIITNSGGTKDSTFITARVYPDLLGESTTAVARSTAHGTEIEIDPGLSAGEGESRALLDGILARLGR